jgi:hypothetical protein
MEFILTIVVGAAFIWAIGSILLLPIRMREVKELRGITDVELRQRAFFYAREYFATIGEDDPDVVAFRQLVEREDLDGIRKNWKRLCAAFGRLERKSGHRGRPLILDYYLWYELALAELARRTRLQSRGKPPQVP